MDHLECPVVITASLDFLRLDMLLVQAVRSFVRDNDKMPVQFLPLLPAMNFRHCNQVIHYRGGTENLLACLCGSSIVPAGRRQRWGLYHAPAWCGSLPHCAIPSESAHGRSRSGLRTGGSSQGHRGGHQGRHGTGLHRRTARMDRHTHCRICAARTGAPKCQGLAVHPSCDAVPFYRPGVHASASRLRFSSFRSLMQSSTEGRQISFHTVAPHVVNAVLAHRIVQHLIRLQPFPGARVR